jgi:predicted  nucleic acid-binding Zn-ribbon protein
MAPVGEYAALSERVKALEEDVSEVKQDVKAIRGDVAKVLKYMDREEGARSERDKIQSKLDARVEMSWNKVMVLAAVAGSIVGAIQELGHFFSGMGK